MSRNALRIVCRSLVLEQSFTHRLKYNARCTWRNSIYCRIHRKDLYNEISIEMRQRQDTQQHRQDSILTSTYRPLPSCQIQPILRRYRRRMTTCGQTKSTRTGSSSTTKTASLTAWCSRTPAPAASKNSRSTWIPTKHNTHSKCQLSSRRHKSLLCPSTFSMATEN